jgi:mono/diheme cytochrome c family protein
MKRIFRLLGFLIALTLLVTACGSEAVPPPVAEAAQEATNVALESAIAPVLEEAIEAETEEAGDGAAEIQTEEATEEVTEIATEEVTEIATEEATEIATEEATEEATEIATEEPTEEVTEVATEEATAEVTQLARDIPSEEELAASVDAANVTRGQELFTVAAIPSCTICHQIDGVSTGVGPNLFGLSERAGTRVEGQGPFSYVYISIRYPHDFTVEGFPANAMFDYSNVLTDEDIYDLIAYLWTLHD